MKKSQKKFDQKNGRMTAQKIARKKNAKKIADNMQGIG